MNTNVLSTFKKRVPKPIKRKLMAIYNFTTRTVEKDWTFHNLYYGAFFENLRNYHLDNYEFGLFKKDISEEDRIKAIQYPMDGHKYVFDLYNFNLEKLGYVYSLLEDEYSKKLFIELLCYKVLGHKFVKLSTNNSYHWEVRNKYKELEGTESSLDVTCFSEPIKHYEFSYNDKLIKFDGILGNIIWSFDFKQYFFNRDNIKIMPEEGDIVIDGGACFGDTALIFAETVGTKGKVFSFDFLPQHIKIINHNIENNPSYKDIITVCPFALSDKNNNISNNSDNLAREMLPSASFVYSGLDENDFPTMTIDYLAKIKQLPRIDFIKMDIEGYELKALKGAATVIEKYKPKLAISLYHKPEDFYEIPLYLKSLRPDYKFYIDHYTIYGEETVLYAI